MPEATPRQPTVNDRVGSVKNLNDGIRGILGVTDDLFSDRPGFISGGGGSWPLADAVRSVTQYNCRQWARADKSGFSAQVNAGNSALCNPYLGTIGMAPGDGEFAPPFTGGQCPVNYYQYFEIPLAAGGYGEASPDIVRGPITSRTEEDLGSTNRRFTMVGTGQPPVVRNLSGAFGLPPRWGRLVRLDGLADSCGNLPSQYRPPDSVAGGPDDSGGINIDVPGIGPITVNVNPNEEGNPVVCYEEIDLCVEIPIGAGGAPVPTAGSDPGQPEAGAAGTTGDGGDDDGDAPAGKELWALKIDINAFPPAPNEYAPGVYRAVCYVYMGDDNGLDHDPAGAMLRSGQLVLAEREGLTKYRVSANLGYNLTVTPYWREPRKES